MSKVVYASPLMTAGEIRKACAEFRLQEAKARRKNYRLIVSKKGA